MSISIVNTKDLNIDLARMKLLDLCDWPARVVLETKLNSLQHQCHCCWRSRGGCCRHCYHRHQRHQRNNFLRKCSSLEKRSWLLDTANKLNNPLRAISQNLEGAEEKHEAPSLIDPLHLCGPKFWRPALSQAWWPLLQWQKGLLIWSQYCLELVWLWLWKQPGTLLTTKIRSKGLASKHWLFIWNI